MKTNMSQDLVSKLLPKELGAIADLKPIQEGEESQAFSFVHQSKPYILRINPKIEGFKKDQYACDNFRSNRLPVPKVVKLGYFDDDHAFCISELIEGITLQDAKPEQITELLQPLTDVWTAINETNISGTVGYGEFDESANGKYKMWQDFILSVLDYNWNKVANLIDRTLVENIKVELKRLASSCPSERRLVHGDFGANNVIVEDRQIKSIIDWENALYGDPLYDIAIAYFWSSWLLCMQKSAEYWDSQLSKTDDYHIRIKCYKLRIALHEIYDNALDGDVKMLDWLQKRAKEILN